VLRASREQYEAEEAERKNRMDLIREQHRKYEESLQRQQGEETKKAAESASVTTSASASASSSAATASAAAAVVESNIVEPPVQQQSTHWRNVIGGGNAPKINKEAEFPSLGGGDASKLMSLAELGATISASSSNSRFNFIISSITLNEYICNNDLF
jgi:hypothetical protein